MALQRIYRNTREFDRLHREKLLKKAQKVCGLQDLLEEWETVPDADYDYVLGLRARLRSAQNQLTAMRP